MIEHESAPLTEEQKSQDLESVVLIGLITGEKIISAVRGRDNTGTALRLYRPCVFGTIYDSKGTPQQALNILVDYIDLDSEILLFSTNALWVSNTPLADIEKVYIDDWLSPTKETLEKNFLDAMKKAKKGSSPSAPKQFKS